MVHISIPGYKEFHLENLVLDYNGTLALDGVPIPQVLEKLAELSHSFRIHILTADTYGNVQAHLRMPEVHVHIVDEGRQCEQKAEFVAQLGAAHTIAIGNGSIDYLMLQQAAIGIVVVQTEGASAQALAHADIVFTNILDALDCLQHPKRLIASLRR